MTKEIIFTSPLEGLIDPPKPSLLHIPEAYKHLSKKIEGKDPGLSSVKACVPFLDALTMGYVISFPVDFCLRIKEEKNDKGEVVTHHVDYFINPDFPIEYSNYVSIKVHNDSQMPSTLRSSYRTLDIIFKIINPWHIKTPPGYSCIFTTPFNRNLPFKIIDGVVDTDEFSQNINFPCFWTGKTSVEETIVEKGTPLALVIPFKREEWKMKTMKGEVNTPETYVKWSSIFKDNYKKLIWKKKSYK